MSGSAEIIHGNALDLPIPDATVDLIVTSPPYFGLRSYQDGGEHYEGQIGAEATPAEFVDALIAATREMVRVLKPSGSIWVNLGDKYNAYNGNRGDGAIQSNGPRQRVDGGSGLDVKGVRTKSLIGVPWRYALRCIDDLGLILRAEVIWSKPNGLPESVTDRVRRSHETWFHFTKQPRYFSAVDEVREPHMDTSEHAATRRTRTDARLSAVDAGLTSTSHPLGKLPGSVWTIPTQPLRIPDHISHANCCNGKPRSGCEDGVDHFAAFPMEWPRRIIRGWSPERGTVLDPFGGTGTTALVAKVLGRRGISVDLSRDYCRLAQWRTNDPGELARAMQVEKPPAVMDDQGDLLEMLA